MGQILSLLWLAKPEPLNHPYRCKEGKEYPCPKQSEYIPYRKYKEGTNGLMSTLIWVYLSISFSQLVICLIPLMILVNMSLFWLAIPQMEEEITSLEWVNNWTSGGLSQFWNTQLKTILWQHGNSRSFGKTPEPEKLCHPNCSKDGRTAQGCLALCDCILLSADAPFVHYPDPYSKIFLRIDWHTFLANWWEGNWCPPRLFKTLHLKDHL